MAPAAGPDIAFDGVAAAAVVDRVVQIGAARRPVTAGPDAGAVADLRVQGEGATGEPGARVAVEFAPQPVPVGPVVGDLGDHAGPVAGEVGVGGESAH